MNVVLKEIETRIKHKIDSVENWAKVEDSFTPLDGELIIYRGVIDTHSKETLHFKVGNGTSTLKALPFAYDAELLELATAIANEKKIREESDSNLQEQINDILGATIPNNPVAEWGKRVDLGTIVNSTKSFTFDLPSETSVSISYPNTTSESISNRTFTAITGLSTSGSHGIIPEETTFTLPTDANSSHYHSAGVGLTGSGNSGTSSGTYTYKVNLVNEIKSDYASQYNNVTEINKYKFYSLQLDKNNKLGVYVPWQNTQDGNYYHSTGTWSGLTYIATANGGAPELAFTIPTGTSSTTVAPGNHNHDGVYAPVNHPHDYIPLSQKGAVNGVATLDTNGLVPSSQLPSYVDDVINGQLHTDGFFYKSDNQTNPQQNSYTKVSTPEKGKIYFDIVTNKSYRYSGNDSSDKHIYVEIPSSLALSNESPKMNGTASVGTSSTAARGDHIHPSDTSKVNKSGDTLTGTLTFNLGHVSSGAGIKWNPIGTSSPFIGYASDQSDGTFALLSIEGTNYQSGLAIGGSSKNLLWKGNKVATEPFVTGAINEHANLVGNATVSGHTIVYPADSCSTYTSDTGALTPAAVKKAVGLFANESITYINGGTI